MRVAVCTSHKDRKLVDRYASAVLDGEMIALGLPSLNGILTLIKICNVSVDNVSAGNDDLGVGRSGVDVRICVGVCLEVVGVESKVVSACKLIFADYSCNDRAADIRGIVSGEYLGDRGRKLEGECSVGTVDDRREELS